MISPARFTEGSAMAPPGAHVVTPRKRTRAKNLMSPVSAIISILAAAVGFYRTANGGGVVTAEIVVR
jgi:hypothetical protein